MRFSIKGVFLFQVSLENHKSKVSAHGSVFKVKLSKLEKELKDLEKQLNKTK